MSGPIASEAGRSSNKSLAKMDAPAQCRWMPALNLRTAPLSDRTRHWLSDTAPCWQGPQYLAFVWRSCR
eukprot:5071876-Pleurochrysis_carterae.AAC.2